VSLGDIRVIAAMVNIASACCGFAYGPPALGTVA
jgi:hypothetical protein